MEGRKKVQSAEEARDFLNNDKDIEQIKYSTNLFHSEREAQKGEHFRYSETRFVRTRLCTYTRL